MKKILNIILTYKSFYGRNQVYEVYEKEFGHEVLVRLLWQMFEIGCILMSAIFAIDFGVLVPAITVLIFVLVIPVIATLYVMKK